MTTVTAAPSIKSAPLPAPIPERIYILADDLTGACDAAAAFLNAGRTVRVWLGDSAPFAAPESVQAFNSASRSLPPAKASRIVRRVAHTLAGLPGAMMFKKIDSAARGPLAAEVLAAQRGSGARAVLLAPAFPAAGRTVRNGILEVKDAAGQITHIDLVSLFSPRDRALIQRVARPSHLAAAIETGKPVLLCDSRAQSSLEAFARSAGKIPGLLLAGSAGLAQALAATAPRPRRRAPSPSAARTLLIVGSDHPLTRLQLAKINCRSPRTVRVLRIHHSRRDPARILGAFRSFAPQALILTGGDTALFAANVLGAHSLVLQGQLAPGIPWGIVQGGVAENCLAITKSGGFGSPAIFNQILSTLRGAA